MNHEKLAQLAHTVLNLRQRMRLFDAVLDNLWTDILELSRELPDAKLRSPADRVLSDAENDPS